MPIRLLSVSFFAAWTAHWGLSAWLCGAENLDVDADETAIGHDHISPFYRDFYVVGRAAYRLHQHMGPFRYEGKSPRCQR